MAHRIFNVTMFKIFMKKVLPYAGTLGVISDIATPLASFADYFTILAVFTTITLSVYWFFFANRSSDWSMEQGFMPRALVYAGMSFMVFGFFSVSQAITKTSQKGLIANIVPGIAEIQKSVFRLEKTTKEMNAKLDRIEDQIDKKYTLEEIKILTDQEMWDEALAHIEDTHPLKRGEDWRAALGEIAEGWLYDQEIAEDWDKAHQETSVLFKRFKVLKKNPEAMKYRKKIGLRYLEKCLRAKPLKDCHPASIAFIRYDKNSVEDLGFAVGRLTSYHRFIRWSLEYYDFALNEETKDKYCQDNRLQAAIENGWYGFPGDRNMQLTKRMSGLCFEQMEATFRKGLDEYIEKPRKLASSSQMICDLFKEQGADHEACNIKFEEPKKKVTKKKKKRRKKK